jgi:quinol monooxygenase YgiN
MEARVYARVIRAEIEASKLEDLMQVVQKGIVPTAREQAGFEGMLGLVDRTTGQAILVSLWESTGDVEATETSGYLQSQIARATPFLNGPTYRETYEVVLNIPASKNADRTGEPHESVGGNQAP